MDRRELDEIERFFASTGHRTPLAYYGLGEDAAPEAVDVAIKKRRTWAQGQQANPKYRVEALFLIKSNALLRRLLIDERELYAETFGEGNPKLTELAEFTRRTLGDSGWNGASEGAIRVFARRLEIDEGVVEARIGAIARELNLSREGDEDLGALGAVDVYELLQIVPTADSAALAAAYRGRYRWARSLKDLEKSSRALAMLDAAWRIVRDPERRAEYDLRRGEVNEETEEVSRGSQELNELLREGVPAEPDRSAQSMLDAVRVATRSQSAPADAGASAVLSPRPPPEPPPLRSVNPTLPPFTMMPPFAANPAPPSPAAPPDAPVPNISGRTIGLAEGPQMVRERAPKLVVPVKSPVRLQLPRRRTITWMLKVQNGGQGRMPGRITSDQPWLVPAREWLDPQSREQDIAVELQSGLLDGNEGTGTLTVVSDHGERRSVTFEVTRASYTAPLLGLLMVVGLAGGGYFALREWQASQVVPPPAVAHLRITPPADHVRVDGVEVGHGAAVDAAPPVRGTPFRLEVEAEGVVTLDQSVTVGASSYDLPITLLPDEAFAWSPAHIPVAALPPTALGVLTEKAPELGACFIPGKPREAVVRFTVRVASDGKARGLDLTGEGVNVVAARPCVAKVVKGLRFPGATGPRSDGSIDLTLQVGR